MRQPLGVEDIVAIAAVLVISASIGIFFRFSGGRQKTTKEFLMAGRAMSPFPVVFSLIVTFVSAVMMVGVPGEVYDHGLYRMSAYICSTISNVISAYIFLPVYFNMGDSVSVYEYLERRFGKLTRKFASLLFILQSVLFMAVVLVAPALALSAVVEGIDVKVSIACLGGLCTMYCCLGGMKAVLWTDVFQAIIMYTAIFAICIRGIVLADSIPEALIKMHENKPSFFSFDPTTRYTLWNCLTYGFLYGFFNYGCNQAQVQRMLSVKNLKSSQRAVLVSIPLAILFITTNFFVGVVMFANYSKIDPEPEEIKKRDQMVPYFVMNSFKQFPGLAGLCVAGIFSGSLSTISSSVNSLAAVTMEDFVQPYLASRNKITDGKAAFLAKLFACLYGIIGMAFAFAFEKQHIVKAYTVVYGIISGPVLGLFTLGMMTITTNEKGAVRGVISGVVTTLLLGGISFVKIPNSVQNCPSETTTTSAIINSTQYMTTDLTHTFNYTTEVPNSYAISTTAGTSTQKCGDEKWMSFMWLLTTGFLVTVAVGYVASLLLNRSKKKDQEKINYVDPILLSPLVKKWIMPGETKNEEELVKLNGASPA